MGHAGRRDDVHLQQAEAGYRTEVGWGGMEMSWGVLMHFRIGNGLELALFLLSLVVSLCLSLSLSLSLFCRRRAPGLSRTRLLCFSQS